MTILQILPLIIGSAGLVLSLYTIIERQRDTHAKELAQQAKEISDIRSEIATLKTQIGVFWKVVETNVASMLHKPTHIERDHLLEKMRDRQPMSEAECKRLIELLSDIVEEREPTTAGERIGAVLLMARLESKLAASKKAH
jgi:hypothetical protein